MGLKSNTFGLAYRSDKRLICIAGTDQHVAWGSTITCIAEPDHSTTVHGHLRHGNSTSSSICTPMLTCHQRTCVHRVKQSENLKSVVNSARARPSVETATWRDWRQVS